MEVSLSTRFGSNIYNTEIEIKKIKGLKGIKKPFPRVLKYTWLGFFIQRKTIASSYGISRVNMFSKALASNNEVSFMYNEYINTVSRMDGEDTLRLPIQNLCR